jgi:hypothetical protein
MKPVQNAVCPNFQRRRPCCLLAAVVVLAWSAGALALVNPQLQPRHLVERYKTVISGRITRVDLDAGVVTFEVRQVCLGSFSPKEVSVAAEEADDPEASLFNDTFEGEPIIAYVGQDRERHEGDVLLYAGRQWHEAVVISLRDLSKWRWQVAMGDDMVGTFNGDAGQLYTMMADAADGRDFFPARPTVKFRSDIELGTFRGRIRGVALYDIDADGRPDVFACHPDGSRAYIQTSPGPRTAEAGDAAPGVAFEDRTGRLGLDGIRCVSCSFADVNADGRADLLADGVIHLASGEGFRKSDLLPPSADTDVKLAAFVEINGDGYPDVVVSRVKGGLRAYLNGGPAGAWRFADATASTGLDRAENGAGKTGFFAPGDWNGDGRTDLYYAVDKGLILVQAPGGTFSPAPQPVMFDYKVAGSDEPGLTGGGGFATLWRPESWDIISAGDMHLTVVTRRDGVAVNVTGYGNEIALCDVSQLATLPADLNMDGHVDLLTIARETGTRNVFHANRGYGSYMKAIAEYFDYDAFPGTWYTTGAWGAAAGDVSDDGATDLVVGGADGVLRVAISDTLNHPMRRPREHPTHVEKILHQTAILTVRVTGQRGVLGADVRLTDDAGRLAGRRVIGSEVLTGCRGPDTVDLAVREPGRHTLSVRFSDGHVEYWPAALRPGGRLVIVAARGTGSAEPLKAPPGEEAGGASAPKGGPATPPGSDGTGSAWLIAAAVVAAALAAAAAIRLLLAKRLRGK